MDSSFFEQIIASFKASGKWDEFVAECERNARIDRARQWLKDMAETCGAIVIESNEIHHRAIELVDADKNARLVKMIHWIEEVKDRLKSLNETSAGASNG